MNTAAALLKGAVITYQWTLRPILGCNCRFYPSCSSFAVEALTEHGALRGSFLAGRRILRCNPWHPGGYDPVPPSLNRPSLKLPPLKRLASRGQTSPET